MPIFRKRWTLWRYNYFSGLRVLSEAQPKFRTFRRANAERLRLNKACREAGLAYRYGVERLK